VRKPTPPLETCKSALIGALSATTPNIALDKNGYVSEAAHNLVPGIRLTDFEADLRQGDGNEMEGKFRAAYLSSALGVNNFAPFKTNVAALSLPRSGPFTSLQFERKCPHGLAGRRSPNLDILVEGPNGVVAIESKCLEYLSPHSAKFAPAYEREIQDARRQSAWFEEMKHLIQEPHRYRWLDAAQLVKHAFGLAYTFPGRPVTLLYLFWEPSNPDSHPIFAEHRAEIARFKAAIRSDGLSFLAMSYPELWHFWEGNDNRAHVNRLKARYSARLV
jgi:hypothetical protein